MINCHLPAELSSVTCRLRDRDYAFSCFWGFPPFLYFFFLLLFFSKHNQEWSSCTPRRPSSSVTKRAESIKRREAGERRTGGEDNDTEHPLSFFFNSPNARTAHAWFIYGKRYEVRLQFLVLSRSGVLSAYICCMHTLRSDKEQGKCDIRWCWTYSCLNKETAPWQGFYHKSQCFLWVLLICVGKISDSPQSSAFSLIFSFFIYLFNWKKVTLLFFDWLITICIIIFFPIRMQRVLCHQNGQ